jgi:hypothetical protein
MYSVTAYVRAYKVKNMKKKRENITGFIPPIWVQTVICIVRGYVVIASMHV